MINGLVKMCVCEVKENGQKYRGEGNTSDNVKQLEAWSDEFQTNLKFDG